MIFKKYIRGVLFLAVLSMRCHAQESTQPNILLIVSEDNGPELGCYGTQEVTTPRLDKLARNGVKFENAFVTYSVCSPSRSTLFTGLYPHQNGQIGLATHKYRMYESFKTLPGYLKEAGYRTGCLGKIHVNPEAAIPFDFHEIKESNFNKERLPLYAEKSAAFINASDRPFFLMVNFPDAHCPWQKQVDGMPAHPLEPEDIDKAIPFVGIDNQRLRGLTADYYNSINRLDESVGMLLDALEASGKEQNTLIIYLGDHGAQFSRGKCSNYEAGLRVPIIINWPGKVVANQVKEELISSVDLLPTLLAVAGVEVPPNLPGISLLPLVQESQSYEPREYVFADGAGSTPFYFYPRRSVRNQRFKLIHNLAYQKENPKFEYYATAMYGTGTLKESIAEASEEVRQAYQTWRKPPEFELYDLENDPYEFQDLSGDPAHASTLETLKTALKVWQESTRDPLGQPELLARLIAEVDSVNRQYPEWGYRDDPNFQWKYPEYFGDFVNGK